MHLKYVLERHRGNLAWKTKEESAFSFDNKINKICPLRNQIAACATTFLPLGEKKVILDFLWRVLAFPCWTLSTQYKNLRPQWFKNQWADKCQYFSYLSLNEKMPCNFGLLYLGDLPK